MEGFSGNNVESFESQIGREESRFAQGMNGLAGEAEKAGGFEMLKKILVSSAVMGSLAGGLIYDVYRQGWENTTSAEVAMQGGGAVLAGALTALGLYLLDKAFDKKKKSA
ncbi:MAG: hypothetical protein JWM20_399 [Patescibacteria group bacterium]|nr:hypothetical protein [Patescibacteria group bacterium]